MKFDTNKEIYILPTKAINNKTTINICEKYKKYRVY